MFIMTGSGFQHPADCFVAQSLPPVDNTNFPAWHGFPTQAKKFAGQQAQDWHIWDPCCKMKNLKSAGPLLQKKIRKENMGDLSFSTMAFSNLTSFLYPIVGSAPCLLRNLLPLIIPLLLSLFLFSIWSYPPAYRQLELPSQRTTHSRMAMPHPHVLPPERLLSFLSFPGLASHWK